MTQRVDWARISRDEFERIVNVLLTRDGAAHGYLAAAPSGRGGDAGIDIELRDSQTNKLVHIYQLKYFPEGFSSGWAKSRKPQISKSFKKAAVLNPRDWTLVVPEAYTANEGKYVSGLATGTTIRTHILGTVELDRLLALYRDVDNWAVRSAVSEVLEQIGRHDIRPRTADEASEGLYRYLAQQDTFSLYWGRRLTSVNGQMAWELFPKRHDAAVMEPLSITVETAFGTQDAELQKKYIDVLGYGKTSRLDLPKHVVTTLTLDGPQEWFARVEHNKAVTFMPGETSTTPQRARLEAYDAGGVLICTLFGETAGSGIGTLGASLEVRLEQALTMFWRFPRNSEQGSTDFTIDTAGKPASSVARVTALLVELDKVDRLRLEVEGKHVTAQLKAPASPIVDIEMHEYADDLSVIERLANVALPFPESMPLLSERIWTRIARMLLEGRVALVHAYKSINATLSGALDPAMESPLSGGMQMLNVTDEDGGTSGMTILEHEVIIPGINIWHPRMRLADAEVVRRRLDEGAAKGMKVTIEPVDGTPFRIFSSKFMRSDDIIVPDPWSITGISEHKALADIRRAADAS
jgi:hypothetical protein